MFIPMKQTCLIFDTEKGYVSIGERHSDSFSEKLKRKIGQPFPKVFIDSQVCQSLQHLAQLIKFLFVFGTTQQLRLNYTGQQNQILNNYDLDQLLE
jgi:hypothetical protein